MADQAVPQIAPRDESDAGGWCLRRAHCTNSASEVGAGETAGTEKGAGDIGEVNGDRVVGTVCFRLHGRSPTLVPENDLAAEYPLTRSIRQVDRLVS